MRVPQNKLQKIKAGIHCTQLVLIFVAGCLTLAVMTKNGGFGGPTGFYFALCFITIPAIIYQIMVPMWSRAWRLNNVYAYAVIDILFALLWFAASIAVAVWNANGIAKGKTATIDETKSSKSSTKFLFTRADTTTKHGTCDSFAYGSASKCSVSKATVGFGIVTFLLFAATTYISIQAIRQYRQSGAVPTMTFRNKKQDAVENEEEGKVWSTSTDELNNADDRLSYGGYGGNATSDQDGLLGAGTRRSGSGGVVHPEGPDSYSHLAKQEHLDAGADDVVHPGRRTPVQPVAIPPTYDDDHFAPSALSPPGYVTSPNGRVQFPEGNYSALRSIFHASACEFIMSTEYPANLITSRALSLPDPKLPTIPTELAYAENPNTDTAATDLKPASRARWPLQKAQLLRLPLELRLQIYEYATGYHIGLHLVRLNKGRLQYRLAWPASPLDYRCGAQLQVDDVARLCRQTRLELMPTVMRAYIVKFPAWTPEFKVQCLYWINDVSETFCRSIDWYWLEGLYWRLSIHLQTPGTIHAETVWEDDRARESDPHRHEASETFERTRFVLRLDCAGHVKRRATAAAKRAAEYLETLLGAHDGRMGRSEVTALLNGIALTGYEQMREEDDGGIAAILPARTSEASSSVWLFSKLR
ncbi:hypothetical protein AC579_10463 [Pseudocercospora musae]|uniref:MARVEL domain-containing protein n=1 Tax=Pseudocercospora musae TaxID=113226 RepID=A0A139IEA0_9PEZI|nr:hypothetical protein AC579_10463 [Pseudocercospora musae]